MIFQQFLQDIIWEFALLCNECWVYAHTSRFGLWVTPAGQVCWSLHKEPILELSLQQLWIFRKKNQFHWRKSYRTKYHKTLLCAMPTIASGRMHFPFASEAQYGSRYRSISFSRIASNNKLISYKSFDKLLWDLGWFWISWIFVDHKFFMRLE